MDAVGRMSVLLSLRLLPFAVCVVTRAATARRSKGVSAALGYAALPALACALGARTAVVLMGFGWAYIFLISLAINPLSRAMRAGTVSRGGAAVLIFFGFIVLPGVILPGDAMTFLIVGWEVALSSYSYCVETSRRSAARASTRDCLFFLLVNPTLVYTMRGKPMASPASESRGALRFAGGFVVFFVKAALLRPIAFHLRDAAGAMHAAAGTTVTEIGMLVAYGALRVLTVYAAHSGLASMEIGLMRQLGWQVPERYRYPLAAVSPMDFWRRWNTYVRVWLEMYLFLPLARRVARVTKRPSGQAAVVVITLIGSGLIHDAQDLGAYQRITHTSVALFTGAAALILVWRYATRLTVRLRTAWRGRDLALFDTASRLCARASLACALIFAAVHLS
jgi:hypothetical protein